MDSLEHIRIDTGPEPRHAVIWLHGLGADGHDFEPLVPELSGGAMPALRFLFPHAPARPVTINGGMVMRAWYDITALELDRASDPDGIRASADAVKALIQAEEDRGIGPESIVLAGFSQGGAIALYTGLRLTRPLAGIIALSCYLPLAAALASERSAASRDTPILMGHGRYDPLVPIGLGRQAAERLRAWGYAVDWRDYEVDHGVVAEEVADIRAWLGRRFAPSPAHPG